jgi:hypothetical protein
MGASGCHRMETVPAVDKGHNAGSSRSRGSRGNPSPSQAGMRPVASEISERFSMISRCKSLCLRPKLSVSRLSQPQARDPCRSDGAEKVRRSPSSGDPPMSDGATGRRSMAESQWKTLLDSHVISREQPLARPSRDLRDFLFGPWDDTLFLR